MCQRGFVGRTLRYVGAPTSAVPPCTSAARRGTCVWCQVSVASRSMCASVPRGRPPLRSQEPPLFCALPAVSSLESPLRPGAWALPAPCLPGCHAAYPGLKTKV
eukprot:scaffold20636_cov73-Phaeocystis_antarctica.AAC.1